MKGLQDQLRFRASNVVNSLLYWMDSGRFLFTKNAILKPAIPAYYVKLSSLQLKCYRLYANS